MNGQKIAIFREGATRIEMTEALAKLDQAKHHYTEYRRIVAELEQAGFGVITSTFPIHRQNVQGKKMERVL